MNDGKQLHAEMFRQSGSRSRSRCGCSFSFRLAVCTALPVCFIRLAFFVRYIFGQDAHEVYAKQTDVTATVFHVLPGFFPDKCLQVIEMVQLGFPLFIFSLATLIFSFRQLFFFGCMLSVADGIIAVVGFVHRFAQPVHHFHLFLDGFFVAVCVLVAYAHNHLIMGKAVSFIKPCVFSDFLFQAFQQQGTWFWRCMKHQFKDSLFKSCYIVPFRVEINDEFLLFKRESMAYNPVFADSVQLPILRNEGCYRIHVYRRLNLFIA